MSTDLFTRDSLRNTQGGVFAYLSASRLNKWLVCPLAFKLQYLDGIRPPTTPSLFLGKAVHAGLEVFYRHRQLGMALATGELSRRLGDAWGQMVAEEGMKFESAAEEGALQKQAADLVSAYLGRLPPDEPRPLAVEAAMEAPLVDPIRGEDLGIPLVGIVDLILDGHDGPVISDFKTSARSAAPLEITHEVQLTSYAYLFRHAAERQEAALEIRSLIKTKTPKIEFHSYPARTDAHFRRLFSLIRAYLDALDAGRFVFRPGWGCSSCEHQEQHCRAWCG